MASYRKSTPTPQENSLQGSDTTRYPVAKTSPEDYRYLNIKRPIDLRTPSNIETKFEYDPATDRYLLITKLGGKPIGAPIPYTRVEYMAYIAKHNTLNFFRDKDKEAAEAQGKKGFNPLDMNFELGPAEKVFGPGGIKLRTQGSAELLMGLKTNATDNPSIPESARNHTFFDFDEKIQLSLQASVGTKLNFNMNYNTESSFDFDAKKLKLAYEGEEDDIIKLIEAGNVSMQSKNSLIQGGSTLFGIHSKMKFGKLDVDFVLSQQEAESKTVSAQGGAQTRPFELSADSYDQSRHFFLGHFYRDQYDKAMSTLPFISSGVKINRIEVWVTNKRGNFNEARNIVAFTDLGEANKISNPQITPTGATGDLPANNANSLYGQLLQMPGARQISQVTQVVGAIYTSGKDYEKLESARRLNPGDYTLNENLGYISLNTRLAPDEILGVAYEYTYQGKIYQVGEFSSDRPDKSMDNLFVKLLKGTIVSPQSPYWPFEMKNVYSLGMDVRNITPENFKFDIYYQSDSAGMAIPYLNEGPVKNQLLLRVLGCDKLDRKQQPYPDGVFDFVEGYTVNSQKGLVIFPSIEPFGKTLANALQSQNLIDKYVYQELYDSTAIVAKQIAEKNKFIFRGEFQAASAGEISLGAMNVTPGSVRVTAGGMTLTENVDYTVDYLAGIVKIINPSIAASGSRIDVSLENRGFLNMQRKTMFGLDLNYHFTKDFTLGATIMHLSEMPLTTKTAYGSESLKNTLWGLNMSYHKQSQRLTNWLDALPFLSLTKPSDITFTAEFAHLIPGHYEGRYAKGYSYLDDFETSQTSIDLMNPYAWMLSSTPLHDGAGALFPEAKLVNNIEYGNRRALLSWYYIDPLFTRDKSSLTPSYIRNDYEQLSNHYVREVLTSELFPYRDENAAQRSYITPLNLTFYPQERGPYNLNTDDMGSDGKFIHPEKMWGGIMRKIDQSDFEASNIEYVEFWMMDPFIYNDKSKGGDLYINLGDISEEVLKDELKFFENGLPINGDPEAVITTVWGKVPKRQASVYAFDNTKGARAKQDVGFNGLSTEEEKTFPTYADYLTKLSTIVNAQTQSEWQENKFSPINDPGGDNFHHYLGKDYDEKKLSIIERYKYYNGTEGNSADAGEDAGKRSMASRLVPDVEDINQDNTLNESEKFFEYKVSLRPEDMRVGSNYISDKRVAKVKLKNGQWSEVNWYQFKIPVHDYTSKNGGISGFKSIRFMRMFMTNWHEETTLRFGTLKLVRGDWRIYDRELHAPNVTPSTNASVEVSTVNIEENGDRKPVNYVVPPGVLRSLDPQQAQSTQQNEQSMSLKIHRLAPGDARAVYKNLTYDLRRYKRLQMFAHAEQLIEDETETASGDMYMFLRLGADYRNNYYEYAIPLKITPQGVYSQKNDQDRRIVWPDENFFNIALKDLTDLKVARNTANKRGDLEATFYKVFSRPAPNNQRATISILGNPSLSNVRTIMIGVRNGSKDIKSIEVWANELRLTDYREEGGWAANGNLNVQLSDLGSVNVRGTYTSAGFGALDQRLSQRTLDNNRQINFSTNLELGKVFPKKAHISIPFYYAITDELITPQYDPQDQDILFKDNLKTAANKAQRDSIRDMGITRNISRSISLTNMKVNIKSKKPMPYDPANFSFSYSHNKITKHSPDIEYDNAINWNASINYDYSPLVPPLKPFAWMFKGKEKDNKNTNQPQRRGYDDMMPGRFGSGMGQPFEQRGGRQRGGNNNFLANWGINLLPSRISLQTNMQRNYQETQVRNNTPGMETDFRLPVTFMQNWLWNRSLAINWNLTPSLVMTFRSGTNARIEEPHVQVSKKYNPEQYHVWRDSVMQSIKELGKPYKYDQTATLSYTLPTNQIKWISWIDASANYNGTYNWDLGSEDQNGLSIGNTIRNQMSLDTRLGFGMMKLFRMIPYFKGVEERITRPRDNKPSERKPLPKPFTKKIRLKVDSTNIIEHNLHTKNILVTANTPEGKKIHIQSKIVGKDRVEILNHDTTEIVVSVTPIQPKEMSPGLRKFTDGLSYLLMSVRDISLHMTKTSGLNIPGFIPMIRAAGGQGRTDMGLAPGLDFAFGLTDNGYVDKAKRNGWLMNTTDNINPSTYSTTRDFDARITLEPLKDLKVTLTAKRTSTEQIQTQYMFEGNPQTFGGNFVMTIVGLKGFFSKANGNNGYASSTFSNFLNARSVIAERIAQSYQGTKYPNSGEFAGTPIAGRPVNPSDLTIRENAPEVLIPAFLASYTSLGNARKIGLNPFPALSALMPNWNITYNGLGKIEALKNIFSNFTIKHAYTASYRVDSYASQIKWLPAEGGTKDQGFIPTTAADMEPQRELFVGDTKSPLRASQEIIASMPYNIPGITLDESFYPLIGVDMSFKNGIGLTTEWRMKRNLKLNLNAFQIIESSSNEYSLGISYKADNFAQKIGLRKKPRGRRGKNQPMRSGGSLTTRAELSVNNTSTLIRKIQENYTQATAGNMALVIKLSADYQISRLLTMRAFYDWDVNRPLVSTASFPIRNSNFGISFRFSLNQ
ncbi:cell surface protein SprA [Falsiporphyromonas endometrii]|uniref:Cell surface protein SprA n=1 Tax=Falsiporphyromonas endometrii TaxID=1387297 RepID=A0ABV9K9H9_9PORP